MRTMLLILACTLAVAAAAPATYDQRQDGSFNVIADVQNVVFVIAYPSKMTLPLLDGLTKSVKGRPELQERADMRVLEAFVEPSEPYHVEIGDAGRTAGGAMGDARAVEVVIAGRRRLDSDPQAATEEELKLLGATEQCGPDRERDPVTLACRAPASNDDEPAQAQPEEKPLSTQREKPQITPAANPSPEVVPVL